MRDLAVHPRSAAWLSHMAPGTRLHPDFGPAYGEQAVPYGIPVTIVAPVGANPLKLEAMRGYGATIIEHGVDYDEAREECERRAAATGVRYVHSGNEPYLIAGVGTAALEVLEERPDIEVLIVPVGGGSGAAGACIVAKKLRPSVRVIGVQSSGAPAAYLSWRDRRPQVGGPIRTFAEGLATRA